MTTTTRVTRLHVAPEGEPIYTERAFTVEVEDEAGGEFLLIHCLDTSCKNGQLRIDPKEWPALRDAIERMIGECRE